MLKANSARATSKLQGICVARLLFSVTGIGLKEEAFAKKTSAIGPPNRLSLQLVARMQTHMKFEVLPLRCDLVEQLNIPSSWACYFETLDYRCKTAIPEKWQPKQKSGNY